MSEQPPLFPDDPGPGDEFSGIYPGPEGTRHTGEAGEGIDPGGSTFRSRGMRQAWDEARRHGAYGMTVREYRDKYDIHHGIASAHLSNLHAAGYLAKLKQRRERCGIYVVPSEVGGRATVPHVSNAPKRRRDVVVEKEVVREVMVEVPVETIVVKEVMVEVPVEVVTVVEKEVVAQVEITKADVSKVLKRWQEDKIKGRVFGVDGLADALMQLIRDKMKGKEL